MDRARVRFQIAPPQAAEDGTLAGLFPGQGSHTPEMRETVRRLRPELLQACIELVGEDPFARVAQSTRFAQPAIFCASVVALQERRRSGAGEPFAYAGHSLGELAALVAAGAIGLEDGLRLAVRRGELMAAAGESSGSGGMLALLGASEEQCEALAAGHGLVVANQNAPGQSVLAGPADRLREAAAAARGNGLRALMLDVAAAFHSPAMAAAVEPFREELARVDLSAPRRPVVSCATARPFFDVANELADAIVMPVRWMQTMDRLVEMGAREFVDYGPGRVLARLTARNVRREPAAGAPGSRARAA